MSYFHDYERQQVEQYMNHYLRQYYIYCQQAVYSYTAAISAKVVAEVYETRKRTAATAALLCFDQPYRKKRCWVSSICALRKEHGFFNVGVPKLKKDSLEFYNYFRMTSAQFEEIFNIVGPHISKQFTNFRDPVLAAERLCVTLRYLASGDLMKSFHYSYFLGDTTIQNIIKETCEVIWDNLKSIVLPKKIKAQDWLRIAKEFGEMWNFPNCIGAIDGKHIVIQCPGHAGSMFYNYKGTHSIVLLAICDARYRFICVDIGAKGRRSDGGIFTMSKIYEKLEQNKLNIPPPRQITRRNKFKFPFVLVGDEAFPLKHYLMRAYPSNNLNRKRRIYNYRLCRARRMIENSFGILAAKWRIFRRAIEGNVEMAENIVKATICLHNWLQADDKNRNNFHYIHPDLYKNSTDLNVDAGGFQDVTKMSSNNYTKYVKNVREEYCSYFNKEGKIDWQQYYA